MKAAAAWAGAAVLATAVASHGSCLAGENNAAGATVGILGGLVGSVVPTAELNQQHARGIKNVNVNTNYTVESGSLNSGALRGNSVTGTSDTGTITTTG